MSVGTVLPGSLRRRVWRWHFLAALLVVPFVLWQSLTGTLYLWSYAWIDAQHPALRFVEPVGQSAGIDAQLTAARKVRPGSRITSVLIPADPLRSTQVMFEDARGLPVAVFVDPYRALALGRLDAPAWLPGWSRKLHGGWPAGEPGSWLLELGACWTIVMVLTGLLLWWPRNERTLWQAMLPRLRSGARIFWTDLHACVAIWFSLLIVTFLLTALPWTSFWSSAVLKPLQRMLHQQAPIAAGFAPVSSTRPAHQGESRVARLEDIVRDVRARGTTGDLVVSMVDGPAHAAVSVRSQRDRAAQEQYALYDRYDGARVGAADWDDFPVIAKAVASGIDLHEGSYFGRAGPWLNTVLAGALVWISITGFMAWWRRKPEGALGVPPRVAAPWPGWLGAAAVVLCALLPLLALSASLVWLAERVWLKIHETIGT